MDSDSLFQYLKARLRNRLPRYGSHLKMLPPGRSLHIPAGTDSYMESAVLILLYPSVTGIQLFLIRRPSTMKNHAGQIAFPGGRREPHDADLVRTALREAQEEIGIEMDAVEVAGVLSPVFVQVSDFLITPVVGWLSGKADILIDPSEVDEVILISLDDIISEVHQCSRKIETRSGSLEVPGYDINGNFIWGATAMMLAELSDIVNGENQL